MMESKNQLNKNKPYLFRYFLAFLISTILFILIFLLANTTSYLNYQSITSQNNIIEDYILDLDKLLDQQSCSNILLTESSDKLDRVGSKLSLLEKRFGKIDPRVLEQKERYTKLELQHFKIIKKLNSECNANFITILFFYSNLDNLEEESERTGFILGTYKNQAPNRIMIYSFDYNLQIQTINELKTKYEITNVPIIIINENEKINLRNIEDLENFL